MKLRGGGWEGEREGRREKGGNEEGGRRVKGGRWREEGGGRMERGREGGWREKGAKEEGGREEGGGNKERRRREEGEREKERASHRTYDWRLKSKVATMTTYIFSNYWAVMHNDIIYRVKHLGIVVRVCFSLSDSDKHNHYLARQTGWVTPGPGATHLTFFLGVLFAVQVNRFLRIDPHMKVRHLKPQKINI